jgi:PAS domain S-box-containing protein
MCARYRNLLNTSTDMPGFLARSMLSLVLLLVLVVPPCMAQSYRPVNYGNEEGLPTDLTKAILQDSAGFIWIGTDAGLVRFDGVHFRTFEREIPSPFVKRLLLMRDGRLLVVTDRGIGLVTNDIDRMTYLPLVNGRSVPTDSTISYPKAAYEAYDGSLWISESNAVVHWKAHGLRRYAFDEQFSSESYVRSFLVTQDDQGRILAASENGALFLFDSVSSSFRRVKIAGGISIARVDAVLRRKSGDIFLGCQSGVFALTIGRSGETASLSLLASLPRVSSLVESADGTLYAGTWRNGVFIVDAHSHKATEIRELRQRVINDVAFTASGRLLVSADEGICIVQKSLFARVPLPSENYFIHALTGDLADGAYATDGITVFHLRADRGGFATEILYRGSANQVISLAPSARGLWMGTRNNRLYFRNPRGAVRSISLPKYGSGLVSAVYADGEGGAWLCRDGLEGVERLLPDGAIKDYTRKDGVGAHITVVREGGSGQIVAGGRGDSTYLFRYDSATDTFLNLSSDLSATGVEPFTVNDIVSGGQDTLWLATNRGLFLAAGGAVNQEPWFEGTRNENLKSIARDRHGALWLGTERGVVCYHDRDLARYDGRDGLPSMTMSYRSMSIGTSGRIWVGTANGASCGVWDPERVAPARPPLILSVQADQSAPQVPAARMLLPYGAGVTVSYVSMSYPQDRIVYQYRIAGSESRWSMPTHSTELRLPAVAGGDYILEIRARREGGGWTISTLLPFEVASPWYWRWWAFCSYIVLAAGLAGGIVSFARLRREKKAIEEEIRKSEKKYRTIFENVQEVFYQTDLTGAIMDISPSIHRYAGMARSELLGRSLRELFFASDDWNELVELLLAKGEVTDLELPFTPPGRAGMVVSVNAHVVIDADDNAAGIEGSLRDITERKRTQEKMESTLHEKEMLLKEIHHRVKNNMQVISSLLSLQASEARDSATREGLIDSQHRVRSMALVHEKLYRSGNMSDIDFGEYLKSVIGELARSYHRENVAYTVDVDPIHLGIDVAIPCGLIVNELVSNAFKHAFPDQRKGSIEVTLRRKAGGGIRLRVKDDGVGIPEDRDPREMTSMGMGIVYALTDQISATVSIDRSAGTTFVVDFKEEQR